MISLLATIYVIYFVFSIAPTFCKTFCFFASIIPLSGNFHHSCYSHFVPHFSLNSFDTKNLIIQVEAIFTGMIIGRNCCCQKFWQKHISSHLFFFIVGRVFFVLLDKLGIVCRQKLYDFTISTESIHFYRWIFFMKKYDIWDYNNYYQHIKNNWN